MNNIHEVCIDSDTSFIDRPIDNYSPARYESLNESIQNDTNSYGLLLFKLYIQAWIFYLEPEIEVRMDHLTQMTQSPRQIQ